MSGLGKLDFKHIRVKLLLNFIVNSLVAVNNNVILKYIVTRFVLKDLDILCAGFRLPINCLTILDNKVSYGSLIRVIYETFSASISS